MWLGRLIAEYQGRRRREFAQLVSPTNKAIASVAVTEVVVNYEKTVVPKVASDLADQSNRHSEVAGSNQPTVSEDRLLIRDRPRSSWLETALACVDDDVALIVIWVHTGHDDRRRCLTAGEVYARLERPVHASFPERLAAREH